MVVFADNRVICLFIIVIFLGCNLQENRSTLYIDLNQGFFALTEQNHKISILQLFDPCMQDGAFLGLVLKKGKEGKGKLNVNRLNQDSILYSIKGNFIYLNKMECDFIEISVRSENRLDGRDYQFHEKLPLNDKGIYRIKSHVY